MFTRSFLHNEAYLCILEQRHAAELFYLIDSCRPYLRRFLPWIGSTRSISDSREFIKQGLAQFAQSDGFHAGIWYKGKLAGVIGFHYLDYNNRRTSLGYWLGEQFQGQGLMTEAVRVVCDYIFNELNFNRIEIRAAMENTKSRNIPVRLGFKEEGVIRQAEWLYDHFVDHMVYSLLAEDNLDKLREGLDRHFGQVQANK